MCKVIGSIIKFQQLFAFVRMQNVMWHIFRYLNDGVVLRDVNGVLCFAKTSGYSSNMISSPSLVELSGGVCVFVIVMLTISVSPSMRRSSRRAFLNLPLTLARSPNTLSIDPSQVSFFFMLAKVMMCPFSALS